jgi:hypothetical protein
MGHSGVFKEHLLFFEKKFYIPIYRDFAQMLIFTTLKILVLQQNNLEK